MKDSVNGSIAVRPYREPYGKFSERGCGKDSKPLEMNHATGQLYAREGCLLRPHIRCGGDAFCEFRIRAWGKCVKYPSSYTPVPHRNNPSTHLNTIVAAWMSLISSPPRHIFLDCSSAWPCRYSILLSTRTTAERSSTVGHISISTSTQRRDSSLAARCLTFRRHSTSGNKRFPMPIVN